jgi:F-type H+-transporting ATPase subunit b
MVVRISSNYALVARYKNMEELIGTFHIDASLLIAQVVNFLIVFVVLYFFAIKPLKKVMESRKETITKGLSDASMHATLLEETKVHYDNALKEARKEANSIVEEAKKNAHIESLKIIKDAEEHSQRIAVGARALLDQEKEKMIQGAKRELADMVVSATEKVLEGTLTTSIDKSVVDKVLSDIQK